MTTGSLSDLKRAIDIKLEVQTSVRLIPEIVGQTTSPHPFVIAFFIEHAMVIRLRVRHGEVRIAEGDEDHRQAVGFLGIEGDGIREDLTIGASSAFVDPIPHLVISTKRSAWRDLMRSLGYARDDTMGGRDDTWQALSLDRQDDQAQQHAGYDSQPFHGPSAYFFGHQGLSVLKKSLPLSSTRMKAGKSSTSIFQTASIPSSGYSTHSMLLMLL